MKKQMLFNIDAEPEDDAPASPLGKDEMNFAEGPIALLTDRVPKGQKTIRVEYEVYSEKRKKKLQARRVIEGSEEYGLPTATDDLVILALIQLTKLRGDFQKREVEFTRLELLKLLGWADEGKNFDRIKLSLLRIKVVNYIYDNAWWDPKLKDWTTKAFSIIDNVDINDSRTGQGGLFPSRIVWNEVVFGSFQAGFIRDIDFQLCMQLKHPTALRMYRFLGKRFYSRPEWIFDLKEFADKHIGLGRNYEGGSAIARKLKPAISELEAVGFLEPLPEDERFIKKGREWSIRFLQKAAALPITEAAAETPGDEPASLLLAALTMRGVTAKTASELLRNHPAERIRSKLEVFDWLKSQKDKRIAKSPAGYLVKSINDDYAAPQGFTSLVERQRHADAAKVKEQQIAEERRRVREADALATRRQKQADEYWTSLTPEQQAALDAQIDAATDPETQANEKMGDKGFHHTLRVLRRRDHIIQLLESETA